MKNTLGSQKLEQNRAEVISMAQAGKSYTQLAKHFSVARTVVRYTMDKWRSEDPDIHIPSRKADQFDYGNGVESTQRAADKRFVKSLALAFKRGDHLPRASA